MKIYFVILLSSLMGLSYAQDTLQMDELISTALQNNLNLKIAKNNTEGAKINATIGNAGFLPTADLSGAYNYANTMTKTTFNGGIPEQTSDAAASQNYNANLNIRYTLFDGFKPVYKLKLSKKDLQIADLNYRNQVDQLIIQVIEAAFTIALIKEDLVLAQEKRLLNQSQLKRIETKLKYGQGSETEKLNLLTTANNDSLAILQLMLTLENNQFQLNRIIGTELLNSDDIFVIDTLLASKLQFEQLLSAAQSFNPNLLLSRAQIDRSELDYQITKSELYPKLNTVISYGYNGAKNDVGILNTNDALGPSINLGLTYNLYAAGALKRAKKQNELAITNAKLNAQLSEYEIEQNLKAAFQQYQQQISMLPLLEQNVVVSQTNFERVDNAFSLGQLNFLNYQQAQFQLFNAKKELLKARYNCKFSEWQLRFLSGTISE